MPDTTPFPGLLMCAFILNAFFIAGGVFNPVSGVVILAVIYGLSAYDRITAEIEYHREKRNFNFETLLP